MESRLFDPGPLQRALASLDLALRLYRDSRGSEEERDLLRDGVVQRFEYGFELSWKLLRRFLTLYGLERVEQLTNREIFRLGFEQGLLDEADTWLVFLRHRNLTSHIYDEATAQRVFSSAEPFLNAASELLRRMQARSV